MTVSRRRAFGLIAVAPAALSARAIGPQRGDVFVAVSDATHRALRPGEIRAGAAPVLSWPMDRTTGLVRDGAPFNQMLLLCLADGVVAFSAVCTHAGCIVSAWIADRHVLLCPCHGSQYDPARDGAVVAGPAPQPLPTLPVGVADGVLVVAGGFSARPGGHTGRTD
jgi:rieske iron-sulfur protein